MQIETNIGTDREHEIMAKIAHFYDLAVSGNANLYDRMDKNNRYVCGDQWDSATKDYNESRGKFCLTIPLIRPQIKQLVGHVIQNPKDISVLNYRGGMKVLADLQTALIMHAMKEESVKFEIVQMFDEGNSTGSGYLGVFIERERDPHYGDLEIRKLDCFDVLPDPTSKVYDPNSRRDGWKFVIWQPWVDKDWAAKKWPEKKDLIATYAGPGQAGLWARFVGKIIGFLTGSTINSRTNLQGAGHDTLETYELRDRISHTWWVEYRPIYYFYDLREEKSEPLVVVEPKEKAEAEKAVAEYKDVFSLEEAIAPVMNHTLSLGDVFLENRFDELNLIKSGQTLFPIVPFHPYMNNGYKACIVDDMIGVQDFINWTRSTVANILKEQPNRGWYVKTDVGGKGEWLKEHGSEDGVVIDKSKFGGEVEQITPAPLPVAYANLTEIAKTEVREVTNIRTEQPEKDIKTMSGIAIAQKQEASITGISPILSNFDYSLHLLGNLLATVIRSTHVYSLEEISKIVDEKNLLDSKLISEARFVASQMMGIQIPEPINFSIAMLSAMQPEDAELMQQKLKDADRAREAVLAKLDTIAKPIAIQALVDAMRNLRAGRYNTTVTTSPASPTFRMKQFAETLEINEMLIKSMQPPLPAKFIIEASDLPNKEQILAEMGV